MESIKAWHLMRDGARNLIQTQLGVKSDEAEKILQDVENQCKNSGSNTLEDFTGCVYGQIEREKAKRRGR